MPIKTILSHDEVLSIRREFHILIGFIEGSQLFLAEIPNTQGGINTAVNKIAKILEIEKVKGT